MAQQQRGGPPAENVLNDSSYTFYFDTSSRVTAGDAQNNDPTNLTNPAVMQVNLSRPKAPYSQVYLASLELPKLAQYTVEADWQNLYFSEGLQLRLVEANAKPTSVREFSVMVDNTTYTALLPLFLNPIVSVTDTGTNSPTVTFQYEHGLEGVLGGNNCPALDDPIRLVATNVPYADALATEFLILDAFSVQLTLSNPVVWANTTPAGYLYCPAIPSPTQLACMVTAALDVVTPLPGEFRVTYNATTGMFSFCVARPTLGTSCRSNVPIPSCVPPPIQSCHNGAIISYSGYNVVPCNTAITTGPANMTNADTVALLIDSSICLPALMGFGKATTGSSLVRVPSLPPYCVTGQYGFCNCESVVAIPPGNYDANTLGNVLSTQLNRFYFPCGCGDVAPAVRNFVFANQCGNCFAITIPCGLYCPNTFAAFLTEQMNAADPDKSYSVTFSTATGFCITAAPGVVFSLEFGDSTAMEVAYRMGFPTIALRGRNLYCSCQVPVIPLKDCCIEPRCLSQTYEVIYNSNTPQFCIIPGIPKPITVVNAVCGTPPATTVTITGAFGHGLSAGDVVRLSVTGVGTFEVVVVSVVDAFSVVLELGSLNCAALFTETVTCFQNAQFPLMNLFFAPAPCQVNPIKPIFLGFLPEDKLYEMGTSANSLCCVTSTSLVNLDLVPYLLLVAEYPGNLFTGNSHTSSEQQTISQVLAKIILYPNFRLERIMNFNGFIQGLENVSKIKLVLLTPDHKPYKMHNVNWSGTLVYLVPQGVVKLTQY